MLDSVVFREEKRKRNEKLGILVREYFFEEKQRGREEEKR